MNVQVVELVRGKDRKLYPASLPRPADEHERLIGLAHTLRCRDGLSFRQVQRVMAEKHGVRRSIGAICKDLSRFECDQCAR